MDEAEVDEMWSYVGKRKSPGGYGMPWITGQGKSGGCWPSADEVSAAQSPTGTLGIRRFFTDHWRRSALGPDTHSPGKRNTQQIERTHLTLRTRIKRLARKTICFSKSLELHDIVIGLFVNRYEFGLPCNRVKSRSKTLPATDTHPLYSAFCPPALCAGPTNLSVDEL